MVHHGAASADYVSDVFLHPALEVILDDAHEYVHVEVQHELPVLVADDDALVDGALLDAPLDQLLAVAADHEQKVLPPGREVKVKAHVPALAEKPHDGQKAADPDVIVVLAYDPLSELAL